MRPVLQMDRDQSNQCHLYEHQLNDMACNILKWATYNLLQLTILCLQSVSVPTVCKYHVSIKA